MIKTHPYRAAALAVLIAAGSFGISALTDEGGNGAGWTEGSQGVANAFWILMILSVAFAVVMTAIGVVRGARSDD